MLVFRTNGRNLRSFIELRVPTTVYKRSLYCTRVNTQREFFDLTLVVLAAVGVIDS